MKILATSLALLVAATLFTACSSPTIDPVKPAPAPYLMQADTIANPYINSVNDAQPAKPYHGKPQYQPVVNEQPNEQPAQVPAPTPAPAVQPAIIPVTKPVPVHKLDVMPVEQPSNAL